MVIGYQKEGGAYKGCGWQANCEYGSLISSREERRERHLRELHR